MKKTWLVLALTTGTLVAWWGVTYSSSEYRLSEHSAATFRNVTIATTDVRRLASFYTQVFATQATTVEWAPAADATESVSLRTPGYAGHGPTLTLISVQQPANPLPSASDHGYAHLCFETADMRGVTARLLAAGGSVSSLFAENDKVPVLYARDPDGNAIEIHIPLPDPLTPRTIYRSLDSLVRTVLGLGALEKDQLRFLHTNHNSDDWAQVATFYREVFNAQTTGAQRDYEGDFIGKLTGIKDAAVQGRHIQLPGYSAGGPTLEAFTYNQKPGRGPLAFSDAGVVAIGFDLTELDATLERVIAAGGQIVTRDNHRALVKDPYGNLIQFRNTVE